MASALLPIKSSRARGIKSRFAEVTVLSSSDAIEILFPSGPARSAAYLFVNWLSEKGGRASKNSVSEFADKLQLGELTHNGRPVRYSRRNFYLTVLKTLVDLGFIQRNVPFWDTHLKKTSYVYQANIFDIPLKPPSIGFWRVAYYICRKWNQLFGR